MGLLNKFRKPHQQPDRTEEILEHLCDLLNTKKEFGGYQKDFGLDSYVYLGTNKKVGLQIIDDIKSSFEKFEKRVSDIDIQLIPNESQFFLSFLIKCKIEQKSCSFHLSFNHQKNLFKVEVNE